MMTSHDDFRQACIEGHIRIRRDEDGFPVAYAIGKRFRGYTIAWNDLDELVLMTPNDERKQRSTYMLRRLQSIVPEVRILQQGDTEWTAAFHARHLGEVAQAFGMLKRKGQPPKVTIQELLARNSSRARLQAHGSGSESTRRGK